MTRQQRHTLCTLGALTFALSCGEPEAGEAEAGTETETAASESATGSETESDTGTDTETDTETGGDPECGNGIVDEGEDCDDGNAFEWDGCSNDCVAGYMSDPVTMALELPAVVPVLRLDIDGQLIEKDVEIAGQLEIFEDHDGTLADLDMVDPTLTTAVGFQGRGNYTWSLPKKGYAFELQDGLGGDVDLQILGLPPGSDFALYACWSDKTCMRNALVYALGQRLGRWSPRTRYVELIIDGEYRGLYMVWERIRRDVARCDIDKPAASAVEGDLSGGYILRLEGAGKGIKTVDGVDYERDFVMDGGRIYTYHYPRPWKLTPEQAAYPPAYLQSFEDAMALDPAVYPEWIDILSWVDHGIVEELTNNWDGYVHSIYMAKTSEANDGRLAMTALWDYDLAFANGDVTGYNCQTDNWAHLIERNVPDDVPEYWLSLFADAEFQTAFKCRWQELRADAISLTTISAQLDAWAAFTVDARVRDQARWGTLAMGEIFPNCFWAPTYDGEITLLLDWIDARISWLDAQVAAMPGACP